MDHTERFDSAEESASGDDGAAPARPAGPGSGVSPFGGAPGGSAGRRPEGAFDAFAAGAPGASSRRAKRAAFGEQPGLEGRPEPGGADVADRASGLGEPSGYAAAPGTADAGARYPDSRPAPFQEPAAAAPSAHDDGLGLAAGAGAIARLSGADSFDAFGTGSGAGGAGTGGDPGAAGGLDGAGAATGPEGPGLLGPRRDDDAFAPAPASPRGDASRPVASSGGWSGDGATGAGTTGGTFGAGSAHDGGSDDDAGTTPAVDISAGGPAPADRDPSGGAPSGGFDGFAAGGTGASSTAAFDGFAAGAVGGSGSAGSVGSAGPGDGDRLPPPPPGATPSLFDAASPVPRVSRPARDPLAPDMDGGSGGGTKVERLVSAEFLLTINHVDGTEVTVCPPDERPVPVRRSEEDRTARLRGSRPTPPPGPPGPELPLLERDEERERLVRLLGRGRSVRLTGPSGAGRTALLEAVAHACVDLAPDGVLWLSGYHRTVADVLQDLYAVMYAGERYRPARAELPGLLSRVGAVVVLDDLEFGGAALEELLAAAPECAFLMSATPEVPAPAAESMVEEVFLAGLTRVASMDLLALAAGRALAEDEAAWAADLWFESEGLPLRFVQAGALLRQRDALRDPAAGVEPVTEWDDSVWEKGSPGTSTSTSTSIGTGAGTAAAAGGADLAGGGGGPVPPPAPPLPSLAESAAPADLLASRLSEAAREALAFAVALDGECPHPSHLPALVGDTHGDAALGELTSVGLAVPVDAHFRLAAGVVAQLRPSLAVDGELSDVQAHTAALHYAWWTGHPSVTPERAAAESEAIVAAMTACRDGGHASAAVLLARTVAPAFAAALHWGAWERTLRIGQEAARLSGEVAEEAYFLHELGVLALCTGRLDRARADLEASIALRAALADRQGTVVGRRTLALVTDMAAAAAAIRAAAPTAPIPEAPPGEALTAVMPPVALPEAAPVPAGEPAGTARPPAATEPTARRLAVVGSRRNLVAAGTGVLIAAVVGTIVTLGATSGGGDTPDNQVKPIESVQQDDPDTSAPALQDGTTTSASSQPSATSPTTPASPSTTPASTTAPEPTDTGTSTPPDASTPDAPTAPSTSEGHQGGGGGPTHTPPTSPSAKPTTTSPTPSQSSSPPPTDTPPPSDPVQDTAVARATASETAGTPSTPQGRATPSTTPDETTASPTAPDQTAASPSTPDQTTTAEGTPTP